MASPFSWPVLVPSALRAPAPVNLGVRRSRMLKSLLKGMDGQISSFTKILQNKRTPLQIGPDGSAQGFFYKAGLSSVGNMQSPEAKIAHILKEYVALRRYDISSQISVIEYRVFGKNCLATDPNFSSIEEWMEWRLPREFKNHTFHKCDGWNLDFYKFAKERAIEHFV